MTSRSASLVLASLSFPAPRIVRLSSNAFGSSEAGSPPISVSLAAKRIPGSFFDTNVLVYLASSEPAKAARAEEVVALGGTVSVQVLNELTNVARRMMHLSWDETNELLSTLRRLFDVVPLTVETHERGRHLAERHQLSVYDAMIVAAALSAGSDVLWTEDLHDGAAFEGMCVTNPFRGPQPIAIVSRRARHDERNEPSDLDEVVGGCHRGGTEGPRAASEDW
jgi:predicted nucleic acid-binding protein